MFSAPYICTYQGVMLVKQTNLEGEKRVLSTHSSRRFLQPKLPKILIHRIPLIDTLQNVIEDASSTYKLVLLCASAGYGKTTLLADFAQHTRLPCCWYFLDRADVNLLMFIEGLISSISQNFPSFGKTLASQLARAFPTTALDSLLTYELEAFVDVFVRTIEEDIHERFTLFLCNYQDVNESDQLNTLVNKILQHLPEHCIVVIESRAVPALELVLLLSRHQLFGLGIDELRFSTQNLHDLTELQQLEPLLDEEVKQLTELFDGWIAGILLGTRLGNSPFISSHTATIHTRGTSVVRIDQRNLSDYLTKEVFKYELDAYVFLRETSVLQQMTSDLCNALLTITDADVRLSYMERMGLFVTQAKDVSQPIYVCHPVLHKLLYAELCHEDLVHVATLHRHAAALFSTTGDYDQAIFHAYSSKDEYFAAQLIKEASKSMVQQGQEESLAHWIDMLPISVFERFPRLLLSRANIHLTKREPEKATPLLGKAYLLLTDDASSSDNDIPVTTLAEILVAQGTISFMGGDYLQTQHFCQQALKLLPVDENELRAKAYQRLGMCASLLDDCTTGIMYMQQALQLWGHNTERLETALLHGYLANAYSLIGNYALAETHRTRAIASCTWLGDTPGKINNMIGMAIMKRNKGALNEAASMLNETLTMARDTQFKSGEAYSLENLGEIYLDQGLLEKALVTTEDALATARQIGDAHLCNHALCTLSVTYLFMGDSRTASFLIDQTDVKANDTISYEGALCELTRGTIFLFQQQYRQAHEHLMNAELSLDKASLKRLHLRALIRLAACQLALEKRVEATHSIEKAKLLAQQNDYKHITQIELQRLPEVCKILKDVTLPFGRSQQQQSRLIESEEVIVESPRLSVLAFGAPTVVLNDTPITHWRMARSMELFFFLLDHDRSIRKEQIIDTLWLDADDNNDQTLRSTVYYLRKTVGESCIVYNSGSYALNLAAVYGEQVRYDVAVFQDSYTKARKALAVEDDDAAERALQTMIGLYRGDYVQSFYSNWCTMRRDELRRMYMYGRQQLALLAWRHEQYEESTVQWQHLLAIDNCLEDAHYGLIRCYMRQGKRGLALRQYQCCVKILQEELSVSPGSGLQRLYERLTRNS